MSFEKDISDKIAINNSTVKSDSYNYIDANQGQVGVSVIETETDENIIVLHFAKPQFQIDTDRPGLNTKVVNSVLGSVELDLKGAQDLHKLLGQMLPKA